MNQPTNLSSLKWGIIGCGDVTEVKSGPAFNRIEHSELVAVMRRNGAKAQDYAQRHGVAKWYDDADLLINDPDVNAIYIATPPSSHAEYTLKAAAAGKPVYVEKPMAMNFAECLEMVAACEAENVPLFVAYYRRALPNYLKVKSLLDENAIGDVRLVNVELYQTVKPEIVRGMDNNWRVQPETSGGGFFYDLASHQFDAFDYLLGPVSAAKGIVANQAGLYPAEDIVGATFALGDGIIGSGMWCFTAAEVAAREVTEIIGSKGRILFSHFSSAPVVLENESGRQEFNFDMPAHIQQPLIQTVVDDLRGVGKCPSTGKSGARTNWVLQEISGYQ